MSEYELQKAINADLKKLGIRFKHDEKGRGKNRTHRGGWPDLIIFPGKSRVFFLELKSDSGQLKPSQEEFIEWGKENGYPCYVARNWEQWKFIKEIELKIQG